MKGHKLFVSLLTLATLGSLASCRTNTSSDTGKPSSGEVDPGTSSTPTPEEGRQKPEKADGVYAEEDAAHVDEEQLGAFNSGDKGVNYSYLGSADRASILGDIESWAKDNHLLGIPLFGDGGWTLMNTRVQGPIGSTYLPNYGFGFQREGKITSAMTADQEPNAAYREFLHQGLSEANGELNQFDSNNSISSDLLTYLNGALYGQRLVKDGNGGYKEEFEWYPSMAESKPEAIDLDEETKVASKWKVKVRTNDNMQFHTASTKSVNGTALSSFNGTKITAKDFVNAYQILLNGNNGNSYASQSASDFVGGDQYNAATTKTKVFSAEDEEAFKSVGIKALDDNTIEFDFTYPMTQATVMMKLTSMAPVNKDFFKLITLYDDASNYDPKAYGKNNTKGGLDLTPADTLLSTGAYTLTTYEAGTASDREIVFTRNDTFIDRVLENNDKYEVYAIKGYVYKINSNYAQGTHALYNEYLAGKVDASGIPTDQKSNWEGNKPGKYVTGNSSITSLQVNSTTPERWEEVFGKNGTNWKVQQDYTYDSAKASAYTVKPVMSNSDFLDGIYFSIDREKLADDLMANPSSDWLGDEYVLNVDDFVSYNSTAAHKRAVQNYSPDTYGYSRAVAQAKFTSAMKQLEAQGKYTPGTATNPTEINISIQIAAEKQRANWANKVAEFIEDNFNTALNSKGYNLTVTVAKAPATVTDIYGILASGCYDLCWGGISGGTGDAIGMVGCWLDNWPVGLQMSVGVSTSEDTGKYGIWYHGYSYSMEAMYYAIEYGGSVVIKDGVLAGVVE